MGGMKAAVRRGGHHAAGSASGGKAEDFNNDSNFGDASKGFAEGDQTLDDDKIQNTMMGNYRKLIPCIRHTAATELAIAVRVRGNGKVRTETVHGPRTAALPPRRSGRSSVLGVLGRSGSSPIARV